MSLLGPVAFERAYSPDEIAVLTAAFDKVCGSMTSRVNSDDGVRKAVALAILKHLDRGERDPLRLAELVLSQLTGFDGNRPVAPR